MHKECGSTLSFPKINLSHRDRMVLYKDKDKGKSYSNPSENHCSPVFPVDPDTFEEASGEFWRVGIVNGETCIKFVRAGRNK